MGRFAVIVIGYNRPDSVKRLLDRLNSCDFENESVTLITSIDNSGNNSVESICEDFQWLHGEKRVITHEKRMGLRSHILSCGDILLTEEFDAVAVFEDDVCPAEMFYSYMKAAYTAYNEDDRIAGISLYSPWYFQAGKLPFLTQPTLYDVYFMQVAQSWGQVWTKNQWKGFKAWYVENSEEWSYCEDVPAAIGGWGKNSWLKYYMRYCGEKKKYFVYPYHTMSTCFAEAGQHTIETSTLNQIPLMNGKGYEFRLPALTNSAIRYDAFFENENVISILSDRFNIPEKEITVDIYSIKNTNKRYWLTTKVENYKVIKSYGLVMKPHEMNIIMDVEGSDIYFYDTSLSQNGELSSSDFLHRIEFYYNIQFNRKSITQLIVPVWKRSITHFLINKFRKLKVRKERS